MIAKSRRTLVQIVNEWRREHPKQKVPGCLGDGKNVGRRMLNFARVLEEVLHDTMQIYPLHFVRIAQACDGSCMVLTAHAKNNCHWVGYHAWLGGDLGSTDYTIVHTCERKEYEKELAEKKSLEKKLAEEKRLEKKLADKKRLEKKRVEMTRLEAKVKTKASSAYVNLNSSSSSNESSDESSKHDEPQPLKRGFQQARRKCFSVPSRVRKPDLKPNSQSRVKPLHNPPHLHSPIALPPTPSTPSNRNTVRLQFLTSNVHLGAIHKTLDVSMTPKAFFDEAYSAYAIIGEPPATSQMAAVRVAIKPSTEWPIVVPWGNQDDYYEMLNIVKERAAERTGRMDVEVSCVLKGR